jgi:hypothetical protein
MLIRLLTLVLLPAMICGCAATKTEQDIIACPEPRPEVCTMDYTPVCALKRESGYELWITYSNACSACTDETVAGYRKDTCISESLELPDSQ